MTMSYWATVNRSNRALEDKAMILAHGSGSPPGRAVDGKGETGPGRKMIST